MDNKGGKRSGAGRPKGSVNKSTAEIKAYAQKHGKKAIQTLVNLMEDENIAPATRRAAAADVLDRGYGRPAQVVSGDSENPIKLSLELILDQIDGEPRIPTDDD